MSCIGIDLGTTNSLVATYKDGNVVLIPNRHNSVLTPSVVSVSNDGVIIGQTAKEIQASNPGSSASAFKRFIGTSKVYSLGSERLTSIELSSLILKSLVEDAELFLGEKVTEAVISVPAYFNDAQRKATIEAATAIGLKVARLINEPTAAAVAYQINDKKDENIVAIVDLGGGTFDVSILDVFDSVIEVRAVSGDNYLGGEDIDYKIVEHIFKQLDIDEADENSEMFSKIRYVAEEAKKSLSNNTVTTIKMIKDEEELSFELTEKEMEKLIEPLLEKMKEPLKKAVIDSGFKLHEIDDVILVGGSTRMPLVKKFISRLFQRLPLSHLNPDEVVVMGAAITAAMRKDEMFEDTVLTDVCPYTLGISVVNALPNGKKVLMYDPLIERNMTIPSSVQKRYTNSYKNQPEIVCNVFQGESMNLKDNLHLGDLKFNLPKAEAGAINIKVRFTYDVNGILEVEAGVEDTGEFKRQIMINANNLDENEVAKRMEKLNALKIHPRDDEENQLLIAKCERLYQMTLGDLRSEIQEKLVLFKSVLDDQDKNEIKVMKSNMKEYIAFIERLL